MKEKLRTMTEAVQKRKHQNATSQAEGDVGPTTVLSFRTPVNIFRICVIREKQAECEINSYINVIPDIYFIPPFGGMVQHMSCFPQTFQTLFYNDPIRIHGHVLISSKPSYDLAYCNMANIYFTTEPQLSVNTCDICVDVLLCSSVTLPTLVSGPTHHWHATLQVEKYSHHYHKQTDPHQTRHTDEYMAIRQPLASN